MALIEQEFRLLQRIQHSNLVPYLAFKWEISEDEEYLNIYMVEQLVSGSSLSFYVSVSSLIKRISIVLVF